MTRMISPLLVFLFLGLFSVAVAQTEQEAADSTTTPKYGPVFQLEIKDQANGEAFRGMRVEKKFARRLPNFYRDVVSDKQRDEVYTIQAAYFEPIEMLTQRLERLQNERDAQIEAVLNAEQKKKVEALRKESRDRAAERRSTRSSAN